MKIIVCGAGVVGTGIAKQLLSEDNDVIVIDSEEDKIKYVGETLDVSTHLGFPSHPTVLEQAGASTADMIIAVTMSDETNMIVCQVAHSLFGIPTKIARIRHRNYLMPIWKDLYRHDHLPIDFIISPEQEVANTILNDLHLPGAMDMIPFSDGLLKVIEVRCELSCPAIGRTVGQMRQDLNQYRANFLSIYRDDSELFFDEKDVLRPEDAVFFVVDHEEVKSVMSYFGHNEQAARRVLIVGGGNIGLNLVRNLEQEDQHLLVTIIEKSRDRAIHIADRVQHTHIMHGDALDEDVLSEAKISETDTLIAITNDDEVNILVSLLAKRHGCTRVMTLINKNTAYSLLTRTLGIDVIINPREMTVSSILQHIRRGKVRAAHYICGGRAEVIEAEAIKQSAVVGNSVNDLELPRGVFIAAIIRDNSSFIPDESTTIAEGDRILVFSLTEQVKKVDSVFSARLSYL